MEHTDRARALSAVIDATKQVSDAAWLLSRVTPEHLAAVDQKHRDHLQTAIAKILKVLGVSK